MTPITAGPYTLDVDSTLSSTLSTTKVRMRTQAAQILRLLMNRAGRAVSRGAIEAELWPGGILPANYPQTKQIDGHISAIRAALAQVGGNRTAIRSIHGVGWAFDAAGVKMALFFTHDQLAALNVILANAPAHVRLAADKVREVIGT